MLQCVDLAQLGLELISPRDARFSAMVDDIRRCLKAPELSASMIDSVPDEPDCSAVLLNHSGRTIACLAIEWEWEYAGRVPQTHAILSTAGKSLLIPSARRGLATYWNTILPGSKRLLTDTHIVGNNSDVQPPPQSSMDGFMGSSGSVHRRVGDPIGVVIRLDGAFLDSGEFAGANRCGLWDLVASERDLHLEIAGIAQRGRDCGLTASQIANRIDAALEAAPRSRHRDDLQVWFEVARQDTGDDHVIDTLAAWADTPGPPLHRRAA